TLPEGIEADVIKGLYRFATHAVKKARGQVRLMGSGTILREVIAAAEMLAQDWQVETEVWSATSFSELARDAAEVERWNRLHPQDPQRTSHVRQCLGGDAPIVAASDYVRAWPQLVASHVQAPFVALGTDGFGRSDTRAALRSFFEVDRQQIVLSALTALREQGKVDAAACAEAITRYGINAEQRPSWTR
ncbi:MAG TPA: pyruvate dehydrogenase (acetyl-transferring), homodimeric type, partial [Rhizobacter sp.]|nr:pyruvate dehydrogenase (acetyl-transferring), homodimeric type [Rhizobacter sp.]